MHYEEILETEDTDGLYDAWSGYRAELTEYIMNSAEHHHIRRELNRTGALRLSGAYHKEEKEKPVLAIWGAGGCNDIDIVGLAKHFKLVLIDRDADKLIHARARFGLEEPECLCVNLHFWDISHEDYELFEALLAEESETGVLRDYLMDLGGLPPEYGTLPSFDYSVVVGLASQLNVRLAVLARMYGRYDELREILDELNRLAVHRLLGAVRQMTAGAVILGYELVNLRDCYTKETAVEDMLSRLNEESEYIAAENEKKSFFDCVGMHSSIAGNEFFEEGIREWISDNVFQILCHRAVLWNFSGHKAYVMLNVTLYPVI